MDRAIGNAAAVRFVTSPNPWVGAVVVCEDGAVFDGATRPPGGSHAERVALQAAGDAARGATVYTTLEPCNHTGRTGPCTEALIAAGVARVVVGVLDPDPQVSGAGVARLRDAGVTVVVGARHREIARQLTPYLHHRRSGRPFVVVKMAASLDGRTAAPDGTSQWITGPQAREVVHRLRAESDAVLVGAGTVRADDPSLTVRDWVPPAGVLPPPAAPRRLVLGRAPATARVQPCDELQGDLGAVLDRLGGEGVLQVLVEGGAATAGAFHRAGLVDRYELFLAPALFGGDDGLGVFAGAGAATIGEVWRGRIVGVERVGADLHVSLEPPAQG